MVTVVPARQSGTAALGANFGQGLGESISNEANYRRSRSRLQNALAEAKESLKPKVDEQGNQQYPSSADTLFALLNATAGIPEAHRSLGPLYQTLVTQSERERTEQNPNRKPGVGGGGTIEKPSQEAPAESLNVFDIIKPQEQPNAALRKPGTVGTFVPPYGPQQFQQARDWFRARRFTPEGEERGIKDMMEYNNAAENAYKYQQLGFQQNIAESDQAQKQFGAIKDYIESEAKEFSDPDEKQMALEEAEKIISEKGGGSPAQVVGEVKRRLRPYQAAVTALDTSLKRPLFGMAESQIKANRERAQFMIDRGQKNKLQLMVAKNGHGEAEEAYLLNPLDNNTQNYLEKIPPIRGLEELIRPTANLHDEGDKETHEKFQKRQARALESRNKVLNTVSEDLSRRFKTGTYEAPGTNLLLLRKGLTDKKLSFTDSEKVINNAIKLAAARHNAENPDNPFKLDPQQEIDFIKLGYPPLYGDAYLYNLMQRALFGRQ